MHSRRFRTFYLKIMAILGCALATQTACRCKILNPGIMDILLRALRMEREWFLLKVINMVCLLEPMCSARSVHQLMIIGGH